MNNMELLIHKMVQSLFLFLVAIFCALKQLFGHIKTIAGYVIFNILLVSSVVAQTRSDLPPRILKLIPPETELSSQEFTTSPTIAIANFIAVKSVEINRSVEYSLQISAFDNTSPIWKMRESAYRNQMENKIEEYRAGLAPESANQGMWTADKVKETKYSWGCGLTQRLQNHPANASEYVTYDCVYFGMIGGIVFKLFVSGLADSPQEGDKWAQKVAEVASGLSVSNIEN